MEISINDSRKRIDIWLTNAEKQDPQVGEWCKGVCRSYKRMGYLVVVYASGDRDLYTSTLDLLVFNKRRCAQLAVQGQRRGQKDVWKRSGKENLDSCYFRL